MTELIAYCTEKGTVQESWERDAPYIWVPWKFSGVGDYAQGYTFATFSEIFKGLQFIPIDAMNMRTKLEVRSFTCFWDNRRYPKRLGSTWIRPWSLFS